MSDCIITRRGGSATDVYAFISVTYDPSVTCTCTDGITTFVSTTGGSYVFAIPRAGTWVLSTPTYSTSVTIDTYGSAYSYALDVYNIFNHGDLVGWASGFEIYTKKSVKTGWVVSSSTLHMDNENNANIVFNGIVLKRNWYTKLHYIAEGTGNNGNWNVTSIGFRKVSSGLPTDVYQCFNYGVNMTNYTSQTNIDGTSPWYTFSKKERIWDISSIPADEELWLIFHDCSCNCTFYSIWLS